MAGIEDTISTLELKLKQAKERKRKIEARKRADESKAKRRQETRRKILVGSMILAKLDQPDPDRAARAKTRLSEDLAAFLTRPDDRAMFPDLLPQPADSSPTPPGLDSTRPHVGASLEQEGGRKEEIEDEEVIVNLRQW